MDFKLAPFVCKCRRGVTPSYLADKLSQSVDFEARRHLSVLRFVNVAEHHPYLPLSTVDNRAFLIAAVRLSRVWDCIPQHVTSAPVSGSHLGNGLIKPPDVSWEHFIIYL